MEDAAMLTLEPAEEDLSNLTFCFCGHSFCHPNHHFGPAVRPNYILHYVVSGKGWFRVDSRTYTVGEGEGFLIEPNIMTTYEADANDPWQYIYIGFSGSSASKILEKMGLSFHSPTFSAECGAQLLQIVQNMMDYEASGTDRRLYLHAQLYQFFACLFHELSSKQFQFHQEQQNYYVRSAIEFIQKHYSDTIKVSDIAEYVGISRSYLTLLFQNIQHMSVKEYLSHFRLTRGREQLTISDLPISTIAQRCGYPNTLVFSKAFKRMTGMTPTQYRRVNRSEQHMSIEKRRKK